MGSFQMSSQDQNCQIISSLWGHSGPIKLYKHEYTHGILWDVTRPKQGWATMLDVHSVNPHGSVCVKYLNIQLVGRGFPLRQSHGALLSNICVVLHACSFLTFQYRYSSLAWHAGGLSPCVAQIPICVCVCVRQKHQLVALMWLLEFFLASIAAWDQMLFLSLSINMLLSF